MVVYWKSFTLSIVIHVLLAIALIVSIHNAKSGNQAQYIINAYLFTPTSGHENHPQQKKMLLARSTPMHHKLTLKKHALEHIKRITKPEIKPQHQLQQASHRLSPEAYSLLITKLHDAIAANLVYPNQAVFLSETGVTYVSFILKPSGEITDIKVKASSHFPVLDKAAIATLNKVSPFIEAENLLSSPQSFTIPIRFQL